MKIEAKTRLIATQPDVGEARDYITAIGLKLSPGVKPFLLNDNFIAFNLSESEFKFNTKKLKLAGFPTTSGLSKYGHFVSWLVDEGKRVVLGSLANRMWIALHDSAEHDVAYKKRQDKWAAYFEAKERDLLPKATNEELPFAQRRSFSTALKDTRIRLKDVARLGYPLGIPFGYKSIYGEDEYAKAVADLNTSK